MNADSKDAISLNVQCIANAKISSSEGLLENAVERFLDIPAISIAEIVDNLLETRIRIVLAQSSFEEVKKNKPMLAQQLLNEADDDFKTLGIDVETLAIRTIQISS